MPRKASLRRLQTTVEGLVRAPEELRERLADEEFVTLFQAGDGKAESILIPGG